MRISNKKLVFAAFISVFLVFLILGCVIGVSYCIKGSVYFLLQNIISIAYILLCVMAIVILNEKPRVFSVALIIANSVLAIGRLYFLTYRIYHRLLFLTFILSVLYFGFCLLLSSISRKQQDKNKLKLNGVMPLLTVGISLVVEGLEVSELIETEIPLPRDWIWIALVLSLIAVVVGAIVVKDRENKKEYVGKLCGVFFTVILVVFVLPLMSIGYVNYIFDTSTPEPIKSVVVDTYTKSSSRSPSRSYYLVLNVDGEEVSFETNGVVYSQYQEGDTACLFKYEGAFGWTYYEYQFDDIYHYNEK